MTRVGFEATIPVFERAKTVHVFDRAATMIGITRLQSPLNRDYTLNVIPVKVNCTAPILTKLELLSFGHKPRNRLFYIQYTFPAIFDSLCQYYADHCIV
jgi:hypothetical protein